MESLNIYELAKSIIGYVPMEMEFVYAIGTIFLFFMTILVIFFPFYLIYKVFDN